MYKQKGFTLLELIISLGLTSVVFLGVMYAYNISFNNLDRAREIIEIDHAVALLCNQFERDISAAFIPWDLTTTDTSAQQQTGATQAKKEKAYFVVTTQESDITKLHGEKVAMLKELSCITTGPLLFWKEEFKPRVVKVIYKLEQNKSNDSQGPISYSLWREEWPYNKQQDSAVDPKDQQTQRRSLIAHRVKGLFLACYEPEKKNPTDKNNNPAEQKIVQTFTWGDTQTTEKTVPQYLEFKIEYWNQALTDSLFFRTSIPVMYHTQTDDVDELVVGSAVNAVSNVAPQQPSAATGSGPLVPTNLGSSTAPSNIPMPSVSQAAGGTI